MTFFDLFKFHSGNVPELVYVGSTSDEVLKKGLLLTRYGTLSSSGEESFLCVERELVEIFTRSVKKVWALRVQDCDLAGLAVILSHADRRECIATLKEVGGVLRWHVAVDEIERQLGADQLTTKWSEEIGF